MSKSYWKVAGDHACATGISNRWYDDACGTALAMELVGERWSLLIVRELMFGARRFGELKASLGGISAIVLTQRLAGLEERASCCIASCRRRQASRSMR